MESKISLSTSNPFSLKKGRWWKMRIGLRTQTGLTAYLRHPVITSLKLMNHETMLL